MRGMLGVHTPQRRLQKILGDNAIQPEKKEPTKRHPGVFIRKERRKYIEHCIP
jgi:hypothetical protein